MQRAGKTGCQADRDEGLENGNRLAVNRPRSEHGVKHEPVAARPTELLLFAGTGPTLLDAKDGHGKVLSVAVETLRKPGPGAQSICAWLSGDKDAGTLTGLNKTNIAK